MAVHTVGSTSASTYGNNITATYNEVVNTYGFVMPADGYVTLLAGYFGASSGGTIFGQLLLFDNAYNLLAGGSAGGQNFSGIGWQTQATGPYFVAGGTTLHLGWFVAQGAQQKFYTTNGGGWKGGNVPGPQSAGGFGQPGGSYFQSYPDNYLQWIDPLSVSGVSPAATGPGQNVTISGGGFTGGSITSITFNGTAASGWIVNNDNSITVAVPNGATSGTLQVNSDHGSGSTGFTVYGPPSISGFSPGNGPVGTSVVITGAQFDAGVTAVRFNGVAASFIVNSATQITATVPSGATTGTIFVQNNYGSTTSGGTFAVNYPPTIASISPSPAPPGASVTITGTYFVGATSVKFNGVAASFIVNSQTQITATVPSGAGSGNPVTVTSPYGTATYSAFTASSAYAFDGSIWQTFNSADGFNGTSEQQIAVLAFDATTWQQLA